MVLILIHKTPGKPHVFRTEFEHVSAQVRAALAAGFRIIQDHNTAPALHTVSYSKVLGAPYTQAKR